MHFFFHPGLTGEAKTSWRVTPTYFELITSSSSPPGTSVLYVTPGPLPYSVCVLACWGDDLKTWIPLLEDPERGNDWRRMLSRSYPTVGRLLDAADTPDLGDPSLLLIHDPDDLAVKWAVTQIVGNVSLPTTATEQSARDFLADSQLREAYAIVLNNSFAAARELTTRTIPKFEQALMYGKEYIRAQGEALSIAAEWAPKISKLFGSG